MTLDEFRREFDEVGIGPRIYGDMLARVTRAVAPKYPPGIFASSGQWTKAELEDLLHEWILRRLLSPRGQLAQVRATANSMDSVRAQLTASLRRYLADRPRETLGRRPGISERLNLYHRAARLLNEDERFTPLGAEAKRPGQQLWTLRSGGHSQPSTLSREQLLAVAHERTDDEWGVVRYRPESAKADPILREPQLGAFIAYLVAQANGALTLDAIMEVLAMRFHLEFALEPLDGRSETEVSTASQETELRDSAQRVLGQIGGEHVRVLRAFHQEHGNVSATARRLGISRATLRASVDGTVGLMATFVDTSEGLERLYQLVMESLFLEEEAR